MEVEFLPPGRICELQAVSELTHEQAERSGQPRWAQLTSQVLPANVRDFGWERGWRVLPTGKKVSCNMGACLDGTYIGIRVPLKTNPTRRKAVLFCTHSHRKQLDYKRL